MKRVMVADIGGSKVKCMLSDHDEIRTAPTGRGMKPEQLAEILRRMMADWAPDAVTLGFPAPVVRGQLVQEPYNIGEGWLGFDFAAALEKPVKLINDAAMQALGSYDGGRMLFLGLGTGLGSAMVLDQVIAPLELAHLPYRKGKTFEDYLGRRGLDRMGKKKWQSHVDIATAIFQTAMIADYVVIGGGNVKYLHHLPPNARPGDNRLAFEGGFRLWKDNYPGHDHLPIVM